MDAYWGRHTVNSTPFRSAAESERYLSWRNEQYPMFPELMGIWGDHAGETVLDYGCGPGDDLVGFLLYSNASQVIGMDVSSKAIDLARARLALHAFPPSRVELIQIRDAEAVIPLQSECIDYINCGGVIHHTTHPNEILAEFRRVLRPSRGGRIMAYNRQSLWFHLYVAYIRMIVNGEFRGLSVEEAFARSTDGEDCPISRPFDSADFLEMLSAAGLNGGFSGGYLSQFELKCWSEYGSQAIDDSRLADEHRTFLKGIVLDEKGLPWWRGYLAGIGGVYQFRTR